MFNCRRLGWPCSRQGEAEGGKEEEQGGRDEQEAYRPHAEEGDYPKEDGNGPHTKGLSALKAPTTPRRDTPTRTAAQIFMTRSLSRLRSGRSVHSLTTVLPVASMLTEAPEESPQDSAVAKYPAAPSEAMNARTANTFPALVSELIGRTLPIRATPGDSGARSK